MQPRDPSTLPRRELLAGAALGGAGLVGCRSTGASTSEQTDAPPLTSGDVVLFQGDSITDAGRSREHAGEANSRPGMGSGYASMAAAGLLTGPLGGDLRVFNRGISGHKVFQLDARWEEDCLALEPDLLSILIGVNDIWHSLGGNYDGTVEVYERDYLALLERTRAALPAVKLVVCEPFVLRCGAVNDTWFPQFDEYRAAARRVSDANAATWVPFQAMFDEAVRYAPPAHWAGDGVHPSAAGAALMAHTWLRAVGS